MTLTSTDTLNSAPTRRLALRARPDLSVERQRVQGRTVWVVKDPVSLRYFQLSDEEYTVLQMLDGHVSLDHLKAELERRYPPRTVTHAELQWLLQLFRTGATVRE